jgi:hypothetical protein
MGVRADVFHPPVTAGEYLGGVALLVLVAGSLTVGAVSVRRRVLPGWSGTPARLAEVTLALAGFVLASELLGTIGALDTLPLALASLAVGAAPRFWQPRAPAVVARVPSAAPRPSLPAIGLAAFATALVLAPWLGNTRYALEGGMREQDTLWYHMPFAARFAQEGSVVHLHSVGDASPSFLPAASELFHAAGIILFGTDFLSPLLSLAWVSLALLGAWCIGRPAGLAPATLTAAGLAVSVPIILATQAGSAKNDVVGLAFLLAAVALYVTDRHDRAAVSIAGLAAGLAIGTRLNALGPVLALTVAVVALSWRRRDLVLGWALALVATGAFWYGRNLAHTGNPLPWFGFDLGPLNVPSIEPPKGCGSTTVADWVARPGAAREQLVPQLDDVLGKWPLVLGVVLGGAVGAALVRRDRMTSVLGLVALASVLAYLVTPAAGTAPCFAGNMRFALMALALGAIALPLALRHTPLSVTAITALLSAAVVINVPHKPLRTLGALLAAVAVVVAIALVRRSGWPRRALVGGLTVATAGAVLAGWFVQSDYLEQRYARGGLPEPIGPSYLMLRDVEHARIAIGGFLGHYPLYGRRPRNTVDVPVVAEPHGDSRPIASCREWQAALASGDYDYVVTAPDPDGALPVEAAWTRAYPPAREVLHVGHNSVFKLGRSVRPQGRPAPARARCGRG